MFKNLLALTHSPTIETGIGRVTQNLFSRFKPHFESIDIFAINYNGMPHAMQKEYTLYPPPRGDEWASRDGLGAFCDRIRVAFENGRGYSHVWMCEEPRSLSQWNFPQTINRAGSHFGFVTAGYFPVCSQMDDKWLDIIRAVDCPVAYTNYGLTEMLRGKRELLFKGRSKPAIIPHGVNPEIYHPVKPEARIAMRSRLQLAEKDFVLLNVNQNQRRKGLVNSFQILALLRSMNVPAVLIMHMPDGNEIEGTSISAMADQLGVLPAWWRSSDDLFLNGHARMAETSLNLVYNCADLVLSTTYGEGFGLSLIEGVAAGCCAAMPDHTACAEIADAINASQPGRVLKLPVSDIAIVNMRDDSRVRYPVDVKASAFAIADLYGKEKWRIREPLSPAIRNWLDWDRIAKQWLKFMDIEKPAVPESYTIESSRRVMIPHSECVAPTPSFQRQTPWPSGLVPLPVTKDMAYFNSGLVRGPDAQLWLVSRKAVRVNHPKLLDHSNLAAIALNENMEPRHGYSLAQLLAGDTQADRVDRAIEKMLDLPNRETEQHEDPRVVFHAGMFYVAYASWSRETCIPNSKQRMAAFKDWNSQPIVGREIFYGNNDSANPGTEKNWLPFFHDGVLHLVYRFAPHIVIAPYAQNGVALVEYRTATNDTWKWGEIRGGTPPVRVGDEYISFFHSSTPWRGPFRRYYMGAYAFAAKPPFNVTRISPKPILAGSDEDSRLWGKNKPAVIFPSGALLEKEEWLVTGGCNDEATFWIRIPHKELEMRECSTNDEVSHTAGRKPESEGMK